HTNRTATSQEGPDSTLGPSPQAVNGIQQNLVPLVPISFYGDRHSVFVRHDDHWSVEEQLAGRREPTQFGRALEQLGVTYIGAQIPQAKGRIERL
ncbi:MAG: hypothetical protein ACYDCD_14915, partial [Candidatus Acidiferrales bacterium]